MRDVVIALSSGRRRPVKQGTNDSFFKWTNRLYADTFKYDKKLG